MSEKELKNENEITDLYNNGNMTKIFENQRVILNKDIIFLKEDILKDFKRIETNLNSKYEKQNSNITNKIYKFENTIEVMKSKIEELSSLISTDKNIQQKVLQLTEFKRKISDKVMNQEITLKSNSSQLKDAINRYDKILTESIIYPGIIGRNGRFKNFHELIDFFLVGMNQFNYFREKNNIDFEEYSIKIENLYKSLKAQTDSIISSCNEYSSKQTGELLTKFEKLVYSQESKIENFQKENDDILKNMENRIKSLNYLIKNINKAKEEINEAFKNEIKKSKEYKEKIDKQMEQYLKEFELINKSINKIKKKIKEDIIFQNKENNPSQNQNSGINLKKSQIGTSIIKKYIIGEITYDDMEKSHLNKRASKENNEKFSKRLTFEPDKLKSSIVNKNNIKRKNTDLINKNSENSSYEKSKKDEYDVCSSSSSENSQNKNSKRIRNKNGINIPNLLSDEMEKSNPLYSTKQKAYKILVFQKPNENPLNKKDVIKNYSNERNKNIEKEKKIMKMRSIGGNYDIINYDVNKSKKLNRNASAHFFKKLNKNKYNYYNIFNEQNIQIKNNKNKLNVIEVNFDKNYETNKEKDDLQDLIKKIKEKKNFFSERKKYNRNNKVKLSKSDASTSNNIDSLYQNKFIKDEITNYKSHNSFNNYFTSKNPTNDKKTFFSKNK